MSRLNELKRLNDLLDEVGEIESATYAALFSNIESAAIFILDDNLCIKEMGGVLLKRMGIVYDDVIGRPLGTVIGKDHKHSEAFACIKEAVSKVKTVTFEMVGKGGEYPCKAIPVTTKSGAVRSVIVIIEHPKTIPILAHVASALRYVDYDFICLYDLDLNITFLAGRMVKEDPEGRGLAELVGKSAYEFFPDIYYNGSDFELVFKEVERTGKACRRVCKTKQNSWDLDVRPIVVNGKVVHFVSFVNMVKE